MVYYMPNSSHLKKCHTPENLSLRPRSSYKPLVNLTSTLMKLVQELPFLQNIASATEKPDIFKVLC